MEHDIALHDDEYFTNQDAPEAVQIEATSAASERSKNGRVADNSSTTDDAADGGPSTRYESSPDDADELDAAGGTRLLGRVATPAGMEATVDDFAFWVPEGVPVEATQIVRASARFPSVGEVQFYGVVESVSRRSRRSSVLEERDRYDGAPDQNIVVDSLGVTYARARVLATQPALLTPPREESPVVLATTEDASVAYGVGEMTEPLAIGTIKNGASGSAGPGKIDLADVLGQNGAHVNVTGIPGAATKSSALLDILCAIQHHVSTRAGRYADPLNIVPVILNVKSTDLLFIDRHSRTYASLEHRDARLWNEMGVSNPGPFAGATFHVPQQLGAEAAEQRGREAQPYSWGLQDLVERNLFSYIFAEDDREDDNFAALLSSIERKLARERIEDGRIVFEG
jgi:hypothetical protein